MPETKANEYAYAWLVMLGDNYAAGAIVSCYSMRSKNPQADLVVMVTHDVSEHARGELAKVFDKVIDVPYISMKSVPMMTPLQRKMYSPWIDMSPTKYNVLNLPYKKAAFVDSDKLFFGNVDEVFDLRTPAGVINWGYEEAKVHYPKWYKNGDVVYRREVCRNLTHGGHVAGAGFQIFRCSKKHYRGYLEMVRLGGAAISDDKKIGSPFGFPKCWNGMDEQSIAYYMSCWNKGPKYSWINIGLKYDIGAGKQAFLHGSAPKSIHYIGTPKVWNFKKGAWPDLDLWWSLARDVNKKGIANLRSLPMRVEGLDEPNSDKCYYCAEFLKTDANHPFLECPQQ